MNIANSIIAGNLNGQTITLTSAELKQIVYKQLKNDFGPKIADRYLKPSLGIAQVMVEDDEGRMTPFSAELYRRDLETIGLTLPESVKIASKLRRHLIKQKIAQISSQQARSSQNGEPFATVQLPVPASPQPGT